MKSETAFYLMQIFMDKYNEVLPGGIEVKRTDEFHQFFDSMEWIYEFLERKNIPKDKFELVWEAQRRLREFYKRARPEWFEESNLQRAITKTIAMLVESAETLNELPWKPWKSKEFNRKKILEEFVDVFHFWMDALQEMGFTLDEVVDCYIKKCRKNIVRQYKHEGYKSKTLEEK